jgi:hypothetical protein
MTMRSLMLLALGCSTSFTPADSGPPGGDAGRVELPGPTDLVDLLFVIDNSGSMSEEQAALVDALPEFVSVLTSGDLEGDGTAEFEAIRDLQIGVVTTDMGTAGFEVPTCSSGDLGADFGDDGVLRTAGRADVPGCQPTYPAILSFRPADGGDPDEFVRSASCLLFDTGGCAFEQQLEAALKAITPSEAQSYTAASFTPIGSPRAPGSTARGFYQDTLPHGDGQNAGLLRDDSVLAIVVVSDEEDCSVHDTQIYNLDGGPYAGTDANLRCFAYPGALHPIGRYLDGFLQLRRHRSRLVYAPIVGIPPDLEPAMGGWPNYTHLVGPESQRDPRMIERIDTTMPNRLVPSCNLPGRGIAFPPVRMVELARDLDAVGAHVTVGSICRESYRETMRGIARLIFDAAAGER